MKPKIEIEKIGRKMPYAAPSEAFFEEFKRDMMDKVATESTQQRRLTVRAIISMVAIAASLLVGLFIVDRVEHTLSSPAEHNLVSESLDDSMDSYFNNLSDDELAYLVDRSSSQDIFYLTLPANE